MSPARYLLWDFGDTLADQRWMWPSPNGVPGWTARYQALPDTDLDTRWNLGAITTSELMTAFVSEIGGTHEELMAHCDERCRDVQFYEHAWSAARTRRLPQAIVTVNSDLFSQFVVPNYELDSVFDVIVTSWEERTVDKARLCEIALERLGGTDPGEGLLLDNIEGNVDAWQSRGGQAYLFRSDDEFARDSPLPAS
jgi:phosphoglycolate phosphatase-like HAD superfamily hydrolase